MAPALIGLELARRFLPGIIGMFKGDKAEEATRQVIEIARDVTGKGDPEEAMRTLERNPELAHAYRMKLLEVEIFRAQLAHDAEAAELKAEIENITGARRRDVEMRQLTGGENSRADWMVALAAAGLVASLVGMVALAWIKAQAPDAISEGVFAALLTQLANLGAFFGLSLRDAFTFEFGSSRGSKMKDTAIATTLTRE